MDRKKGRSHTAASMEQSFVQFRRPRLNPVKATREEFLSHRERLGEGLSCLDGLRSLRSLAGCPATRARINPLAEPVEASAARSAHLLPLPPLRPVVEITRDLPINDERVHHLVREVIQSNLPGSPVDIGLPGEVRAAGGAPV